MSQPWDPCTSTPWRPAAFRLQRRAGEVGNDLVYLVETERERALAARNGDVGWAPCGTPGVEAPGAHGGGAAGYELAEESRRVGIERLAHIRKALDLSLVVR